MKIVRTNSDNRDFRNLIIELDRDIRARYGAEQDLYDPHNKIDYLETVVLAYDENRPVGCGCFKKFDDVTIEIKRMYVAFTHRGKGLGAAILTELELWAAELNFEAAVLETANKQGEAIALYKKLGYTPIPKYGPYVNLPNSICMKKKLIIDKAKKLNSRQ
jgi:putative acetyltransferase